MTDSEKLLAWLTGNRTQRLFFKLSRELMPVITLGHYALVDTHAEVVEVLTRSTEFTIKEINAEKLDALHLHFFLGMDSSPEHDREFALMQNIAKREDLEFIRKIVRAKCSECIASIHTKPEFDLVHDLTLHIPNCLLDKYIGVIDGTVDFKTIDSWMRRLFHQCFLNLTNDKAIAQKGMQAANALKAYLEQLIIKRRTEIQHNPDTPDNLLTRLIKLSMTPGNEWVTNDVIRRNISGLIIGTVDTTSKCVVNVITELFHHPEEMAKAIIAAKADDIETVKAYCWEALRFNPHNPVIERYCQEDTVIGEKSGNQATIKKGTIVFAGIASAMMDEKVFINPMQFDLHRKTEYMHFGYGMHVCYGRYINAVTIPETVAAVLRLNNLNRIPGEAGDVDFDGPFPDKLIMNYTL